MCMSKRSGREAKAPRDYCFSGGIALPFVKLRIDEATQTIYIAASPEAFRESYARQRLPVVPVVSESAPGVFLNYDMALERGRRSTQASGYFDAAVSGTYGIAVTSFLAGQSSFVNNRSTTRLDSFYRLDDPDSLKRLTIGDTIARSAGWSTPFRYGGVQWEPSLRCNPATSVTRRRPCVGAQPCLRRSRCT